MDSSSNSTKSGVPHLVVIGAGFAGLYCARDAARRGLRVTVIDRKNHHTFQPLLYQVASAVLSPGEIAAPIRGVLHRYKNVDVLLGEAVSFDLTAHQVHMREFSVSYDFLVVAAGATHSYFGHDEWEPYAPGLKTIEDALEIRRRVLLAYEVAERRALECSWPRAESSTRIIFRRWINHVRVAIRRLFWRRSKKMGRLDRGISPMWPRRESSRRC